MKTNEKGITIVSLVITVILLIIVTSVAVNTGTSVIKQANLQTINTNMMLIQAKTKTVSEQAKFNKDTSNYKGTLISDISNNQKILKLIDNGVIDDTSKYYLLSSTDLQDLGLQKIDIEDGYVVNYETEEVIYVKGFESNGTTYYKLSELRTVTAK